MKGLFDARHYCYSCHKAFFTVKHLCSASGCLQCRQPGCLNRTGSINLSPLNWTTSSNDLSKTPRQSPVFQCDRCRLKVRSQKRLDCHVTSGVCHLYFLCPTCDNTVPDRAFSNHICSKKRCSTCSVHYSLSDRKNTLRLHRNINVSYKNRRDVSSEKYQMVIPVTNFLTVKVWEERIIMKKLRKKIR